jgi:hypothetical protein
MSRRWLASLHSKRSDLTLNRAPSSSHFRPLCPEGVLSARGRGAKDVLARWGSAARGIASLAAARAECSSCSTQPWSPAASRHEGDRCPMAPRLRACARRRRLQDARPCVPCSFVAKGIKLTAQEHARRLAVYHATTTDREAGTREVSRGRRSRSGGGVAAWRPKEKDDPC